MLRSGECRVENSGIPAKLAADGSQPTSASSSWQRRSARRDEVRREVHERPREAAHRLGAAPARSARLGRTRARGDPRAPSGRSTTLPSGSPGRAIPADDRLARSAEAADRRDAAPGASPSGAGAAGGRASEPRCSAVRRLPRTKTTRRRARSRRSRTRRAACVAGIRVTIGGVRVASGSRLGSRARRFSRPRSAGGAESATASALAASFPASPRGAPRPRRAAVAIAQRAVLPAPVPGRGIAGARLARRARPAAPAVESTPADVRSGGARRARARGGRRSPSPRACVDSRGARRRRRRAAPRAAAESRPRLRAPRRTRSVNASPADELLVAAAARGALRGHGLPLRLPGGAGRGAAGAPADRRAASGRSARRSCGASSRAGPRRDPRRASRRRSPGSSGGVARPVCERRRPGFSSEPSESVHERASPTA